MKKVLKTIPNAEKGGSGLDITQPDGSTVLRRPNRGYRRLR